MFSPTVRRFSKISKQFSASLPSVTAVNVNNTSNSVQIIWNDGLISKFPSIYLKDNNINSKTANGQRLFETHQLGSLNTTIKSFEHDKTGQNLTITWCDDTNDTFSDIWLYENSLNDTHRRQKASESNIEDLWDKSSFNLDVLCSYDDIFNSKECYIECIRQLRKYGLVLINGVPAKSHVDELEPVMQVGNYLGRVRETNYGAYFDVVAQPKHLSTHEAYTNKALSAHTDNPYRNPTPGIQLLHCIKQTGCVGGGVSQLVDGFFVAKELREKFPDKFKLLSTIKKPFTYYDLKNEYVFHDEKVVIEADQHGNATFISFNNRSASCVNWDISEELVADYYDAWITFGKMLHDDKNVLQYRLDSGEIIMFQNNRILHGRAGYEEKEGDDVARHLQGCYIDMDSVWGKLDYVQYSQ